MSVTVTQPDPGRPPLTVTVDGLPTPAAPAVVTGVVQRSTDGGISWRTVRGIAEAPVDGGELEQVQDWEFRPGVVNTYRAGVNQIVDTFTRAETGEWGDSDTGQEWDTSAAAGLSVSAGQGHTEHASDDTSHVILIDDPADVGDLDVAVTVATDAAGGVTGEPVTCGLLARYVDSTHMYEAQLTINTDGSTALAVVSTFTDVQTVESTAVPFTYSGSETPRLRMRADLHRVRAKVWDPDATPEPDWQIDVTIPAGRRITGGQIGLATTRPSGNTNDDLTFSFDDYTADIGRPQWLHSTTITPSLVGFWLCSTMRSFLNLAPMVVDYQEPSRDARGGATAVTRRALPIGQVEVMGGRVWTLTLRVPNVTQARTLEFLIASGDVLWLLTPNGCPIPSGYYQPAGMASTRVRPRGNARLFDLPLAEVAAPGPDVATAQSTWATVIGLYGTWADVVAAHTDWDSVKALIGEPGEVVADP